MMDLMTYLDNHNENERELYFMYLHNYQQFREWAENHKINLQASYTEPETGFSVKSSLYFWIENMEAY